MLALFFANFIMSIIDGINMYFIFSRLLHKKIKVSIKGVTVLVLWSSVMSIFTLILNDINTYKIIYYSSIVLMLYVCYNRKFFDSLFMFVLISTMIIMIQVIALIVIFAIGKSGMSFNMDSVKAIGQLLTIMLLVSICFLPLYELYFLLEQYVVLKGLLYLVNVVLIVSLGALEYNIYNINQNLGYYAFLVIVSVVGYLNTSNYLHYIASKIPEENHDVKNLLISISDKINSGHSLEQVQNDVNQSLSTIGIIPIRDETVNSIVRFIRHKGQMQSNKYLRDEVYYISNNALISDDQVKMLLGILIDNAFEAIDQSETVYVIVHIDTNYIYLEVENRYKNIDIEEFSYFFHRKLSTKKKDVFKHGYGLYNLNQFVKKLDGTVKVINRERNAQYYISLSVEFTECILKKQYHPLSDS